MKAARDIMQTKLVTVRPDMTINEAGRLLERAGVSGAPVVGTRRKLLGVLSRADLLRRHQATPAEIPAFYRDGDALALVKIVDAPGKALVAEVMTPAVLSAEERTPVKDLARFMLAKRVHRVVIVRNGALRGIVTTMDMLKVVAGTRGRAHARLGRRTR
jgi:CBS domain-containing protein